MRITADEFNRLFPVGTAVTYWPVLPPPNPGEGWEDSTTRTEAWTMPSGRQVVSVKSRTGGLSLLHLELDCEDMSDDPRGPDGEPLPDCPRCKQGLYQRIDEDRTWPTWVCGCLESASKGPWTTAEWLARVERLRGNA